MKKKMISTGIALLILVMGCAGTMDFQITSMQASTWMNNIYASHYDEYLTWFDVMGTDEKGKPIYKLKEGVSEKQKHVLRERKKIFVELEPLLKEFSNYVATGDTTSMINAITERAVALTQALIDMEGEM